MSFSSTTLSRIAAFSDGPAGGNPAGVWIDPELPAPDQMQQIAAAGGACAIFRRRARFRSAGTRRSRWALRSRARLATMNYELERGREFMRSAGLVTVALVFAKDARHFDARNAFASGGVLEDPATGAAAAAFAGYLRDLGWPHAGSIEIIQGEDMGMRSIIHAQIPEPRGASIRVSGTARLMD